MRELLSFLILFFITSTIFAQDSTNQSYVRKPALGISFLFNDYITAQRIRSSSLSSVLANKQKAKFKEMDPGIMISYFKGLNNHLDIAANLGGSFVEYTVGSDESTENRFLLEGDVSLNAKLFSEKYWVTPYASIGAGVMKYGPYFGAFIPAGVGIKLNLFDEAHFFINSQYRIPVTNTTANYHFMHSIGIAGVLGK